MKKRLLAGAVLTFLIAVLFGQLAAQQWNYVARLSSDASRGESMIVVEAQEPIVGGRALMIEDRDGKVREVYGVHAVFDGFNVVLEQRLKRDYASGARVYQ